MSESAADLARMWDNRTCPDQGMADQCLYAGGIEDYYLVTQRCECGRVAFLECDMAILPEGGLCVIVPHSATQRPSIHTSTRCADAVDWDSLRGEAGGRVRPMGEQPCDAYDGCEVAAALVLDVYALGQSMQIRVCVEHYRALASTKAEFWDRRPGFGVYTVPDDPLCVVLVGDLRGES